MSKVSATELERQIFSMEEIKVVIRSKRNRQFNEYNYQRKAAGTTSISEWLETRLAPILEGNEVEIIKGDGTSPHGRTNVENVRSSYKND
ncbi:hypothetical protein [Pectinatus cerevisiiphilus]|uniref:Uncharacterized protein n=1 Tax=Pectinatus cerevisiiphilus TaxID=86956 RepID=A0A4V2UR56_9FIRM|nr:hypothetical protein [Pectinatus cerevisiiphilus]TCS75384.1 hypothetical protein EDC37_1324 [Pectinatus cerevisiiphilus]